MCYNNLLNGSIKTTKTNLIQTKDKICYSLFGYCTPFLGSGIKGAAFKRELLDLINYSELLSEYPRQSS